MTDRVEREAWIALPSQAEVLARRPAGARGPYEFGFVPRMTRLIQAHDRIGPAFGRLYHQIMIVPGELSRAEREMIAGVTAAAQDCHY